MSSAASAAAASPPRRAAAAKLSSPSDLLLSPVSRLLKRKRGGGAAAAKPALPVVLGSASSGRRSVLARRGLAFDVCVAAIDERAVPGRDGASPGDLALAVARAKAEAVRPQLRAPCLLITADQVRVRAAPRPVCGRGHAHTACRHASWHRGHARWHTSSRRVRWHRRRRRAGPGAEL
jgi:hypothetical protein